MIYDERDDPDGISSWALLYMLGALLLLAGVLVYGACFYAPN